MNTTIYAGFNCIDITPERPCNMAGYSRTTPSTSVLDSIQVNSMAFSLNGEIVILTVLDSIMLEKNFCDSVKAGIQAATGVDPDNIVVACIHTHSAPAFFKLSFEDTQVEPELTEQAHAAMTQGGIAAFEALQPATVTLEKMEVDGLYGNRNVKDGPAVKTCYLATFRGQDGAPLGAFFNISAHPTILNGSSHALSADLIGQVRLRLEDELGCTVVCTNGTCGDVSTRFYRTASGMEELISTAQNLFEQIMAKKEPISLISDGAVLSGRTDLPSVYDARTDPDWAIMTANIKREAEQNPGPMTQFLLDRQQIKLDMGPVELALISQYYVFGNLIVVTMPGDVCSALGLRIKAAFPDHEVIIIGYANTYSNYLVPEEDYGKYFETFNARTARGVPDTFIAKTISGIQATINDVKAA